MTIAPQDLNALRILELADRFSPLRDVMERSARSTINNLQEMVDKELVDKDLGHRELVDKGLEHKELELVDKDLGHKELVDKELMDKVLEDKLVVQK